MKNEPKPDGAEHRLSLALDVLREFRRGALHESCKGEDADPDPSWHCCDWSQVVDRIDAILAADTREVGYFDILLGLQSLAEQVFREACQELSPFCDDVDERWKSSKSKKRLDQLKAFLPEPLRQ